MPGIGASGAVATVAGAFAVRHFTKRLRVFLILPMPGVYMLHGGWFLLLWFVFQVGSHGHQGLGGGVGYGVHALGFLVGMATALAFKVGGSEDIAEPEQEALKARTIRDAHVAKADQKLQSHDLAGALEELRSATAAMPEDAELRERMYTLHAAVGDAPAATVQARAALRLWWKQGDRSRYVRLFQQAEQKLGVAFPADATHKAAIALELSDPSEASRLHARVIQGSPADPTAKQSCERLAKLFDRLGEAEKAQQVRALKPKLEQASAAATAAPPR